MSGSYRKIAQAEAEAAAARKRIDQTVAQLKDRLNPRTRALELWGETRDRGIELGDDALEFAYEKPKVAGAVAAGGILLLLRRPIWRLLRRLKRERTPKWDEANSSTQSSAAALPMPRKGGRR